MSDDVSLCFREDKISSMKSETPLSTLPKYTRRYILMLGIYIYIYTQVDSRFFSFSFPLFPLFHTSTPTEASPYEWMNESVRCVCLWRYLRDYPSMDSCHAEICVSLCVWLCVYQLVSEVKTHACLCRNEWIRIERGRCIGGRCL